MTTNQISYGNLMEKVRNDQAIEMENRRHNQAIEDYNAGLLSNQEFSNHEVQRHNKVIEQLQLKANEISAARAAIEERANQLNFILGQTRAAEEERHNRETERYNLIRQEAEHQVALGHLALDTRKAEWSHEEELHQQDILQTHYETSDYSQRLGVYAQVAQAGVNVVKSMLDAGSYFAKTIG